LSDFDDCQHTWPGLFLPGDHPPSSDIVAELRDVKFAYRRKKFPKLHDRGELDVILGGKGIGVDAELLASRNDPVQHRPAFYRPSPRSTVLTTGASNVRAVPCRAAPAVPHLPRWRRELLVLQDRH